MKGSFKKVAALTLCLTMGASTGVSLAACTKKDNVIVDGKTINIRMVEAGNGVEWAYVLADEFERVYANEGYQVNILEPSSDMSGSVALTDMAMGTEETGIDLYITGGIKADELGVDGSYANGTALAEDIRELVYNQPAIGYDGVEESVKISDKISVEQASYSVDSHGAMYGFQYNNTTGGLAVNKKKLDQYGLELPKTTNELWACVEAIKLGANGVKGSAETKNYPFTYVSGSNGYVVQALQTWLAQYDYQESQRFWSMQETAADGTKTDMLTNGYEVFNTLAVEEMLTLAHQYMDIRIATNGSTTHSLDTAQSHLIQENNGYQPSAVFMFNGSWMYNEVKLNFNKDLLQNITFINMPVISALGTRLMGSDTSYGLDDAKCDEILSYIVGMVDENKTIAEMITAVQSEFSVTLSEDVVKEIARARGLNYTRGIEQIAVINKNAAAKEPAALFLRMMASDDFAQTWLETANSAPLYSKNLDMTNVTNEFVRAAVEICTNDYAECFTGPRSTSGLRKKLGLNSTMFSLITHIPSEVYKTYGEGKNVNSIFEEDGSKSTSKGMEIYRTAAKAMQEREYEHCMGQWSKWLTEHGLG
ncbi:MAG: extracellular solute-binding protein [Clostridia bacterium]|nr:extracellular solute-binding protein [Clostridia bacterium]